VVISQASEIETRGNFAVNQRVFAQPGDRGQSQSQFSISAEPEFSYDWNDGSDRVVGSFFARADQRDSHRTHSDVRELYWSHTRDDWEFKMGLGEVFWGVTESQHLVDIVNQTDSVEGSDGEDKLGQPMIAWSTEKDWGLLELYWLPYFRERNFPGIKGRLAGSLPIEDKNPLYESTRKQHHQDFAARWSRSLDEVDFAVSYFNGTSRIPLFVPDTSVPGYLRLRPYYTLLSQLGLEVQWTHGDWLWKLEAVRRRQLGKNYFAAVGGFEYTLYAVFDSAYDVGVLLEYNFDQRRNKRLNGFDNDTFIGTRLAFNDAASTELLVGAVVDNNNLGHSIFAETSTRLTDHFKINAELRIFNGYPKGDLFSLLNHDDYMEVELQYYY